MRPNQGPQSLRGRDALGSDHVNKESEASESPDDAGYPLTVGIRPPLDPQIQLGLELGTQGHSGWGKPERHGRSTFREEWAEDPALKVEANLVLDGFYQQQHVLSQPLIKKPTLYQAPSVPVSYLVPAQTPQRERPHGPAQSCTPPNGAEAGGHGATLA